LNDDSAVVQAVRDGDTEAFRLLVERHQGRLIAVLFRLVGNRDLAEELAHETFVKAFKGLGSFEGRARFGTWLIQIGIHAARDHLRRTRKLRRQGIVSLDALREARATEADPEDPSWAANPMAALRNNETGDMIQTALGTLPADYREVLLLKHLEGWSYEDIAALTGDSIGTLKVRAHRARKLLKAELLALGWELQPGQPTPSARAVNDEESDHGSPDGPLPRR
jgi:RNA polymerase sigma-70 factor (ECF subfamily)